MAGSGAYKSALGETRIHSCLSRRIRWRSARVERGKECELNGSLTNGMGTFGICRPYRQRGAMEELAQGRPTGCRWKRALIAV